MAMQMKPVAISATRDGWEVHLDIHESRRGMRHVCVQSGNGSGVLLVALGSRGDRAAWTYTGQAPLPADLTRVLEEAAGLVASAILANSKEAPK